MMYDDEIASWHPDLKNDFISSFFGHNVQDNMLLEKNKSNIMQPIDYKLEKEEPLYQLEEVMMLDDIQKFNETHITAIEVSVCDTIDNTEDKSLPAFTELHPAKTSFLFPSPSQATSPPLNNPDDFLPNFSETSSETFQDLTQLMPQGSTQTTSTSFTTDTYSPNAFSDNSSSSTFTTCSYTSESFSMTEQRKFNTISTEVLFPKQRNFNNTSIEEFSSDTSEKTHNYTKNNFIKYERHQDLRKKNNIASQRSRMTRKEKEREMEKRALILEQENETLRIKVRKMEEIAEEMKKHLLQKLMKR